VINQLIRDKAKANDVYLWEIAIFLKVSEATITRKLRTELSKEERAKFLYAIEQISRQKQED